MLPTLPLEDFLLIDKFSHAVLKRKYQKGDIIISWAPYNHNRSVCKRIAGVAGDVVTRYPSSHAEERVVDPSLLESFTVPPGHIWLLGDNIEHSTDSRNYGPGMYICMYV